MFGAVKKWFSERKEAKEIVAIVFLLETPRLLVSGMVEHLLRQAGVLSEDSVGQPVLKEEKTSYFRCVIDGFELTIASSPQRYAGLSRPRAGLEARLSDGMTRHQGFVTIDCWKAPEGKSRREARPLMAKIAAALTDDSTLLYYDWTTRRMCLNDPEILDLLTAGNLDEAVQSIGDIVVNVDYNSGKTVQAVEEARRRWPEFVSAFATKGKDEPFIAKVRFEHGENVEHMWVEVTACDENSLTGTVANRPFRIPKPREGDVITASIEELSDWLMIRDGEPVGGFVEAILRGGK